MPNAAGDGTDLPPKRRAPDRRPAATKIRVPLPTTPWSDEVIKFALSYNGYSRHGGTPDAGEIANDLAASWSRTAKLATDLPAQRCALFFEQRRAHHTDHAPDPAYIAALLTEIHRQSGGWVAGPADPLP
jgi:hypothetical protein